MTHVVAGSSNKDWKGLVEEAKEAAEAVFLYFGINENKEVEINLVSEEEIAFLNEKYKGKPGPATVLSFPDPEVIPFPEELPVSLGEVFLSPDTIRKKHKNIEITYFVVHGVLHLLGFSHESQSDRIEMGRKEEEILKKIQDTRHKDTNNSQIPKNQ